MARYFFHVDNGVHLEDTEGSELSSLAAARTQAADLLEEIVSQGIVQIWPDGGIRVTIADSQHLTLAILELSASTVISAGGGR